MYDALILAKQQVLLSDLGWHCQLVQIKLFVCLTVAEPLCRWVPLGL